LLGDDVNEDNMNERLGWTMKQVKALSIPQLKHKFEYIQQNLERSNLVNFKRTTFKPKPTLEAPSVKRARQGVPLADHAASLQVPAAPSIAADVSVSAIFTTTTDVSADPTTTTSIAGEVHADESRPDDNKTASEQVSAEHTVDVSTTVVASESDGNPLPYTPYASWEMVPTPLGSIHAYYDMEEHTKHFTSLRELLHMVEKNDLRKLLGVVDNFYQRQEPDTFSLILWGDLCVLFQRLADEDAYAFWRNQESWRIHSWHLYPRPHVHVLETMDG
nr:hypothetical protein [Tanacetum cinerariifolium]